MEQQEWYCLIAGRYTVTLIQACLAKFCHCFHYDSILLSLTQPNTHCRSLSGKSMHTIFFLPYLENRRAHFWSPWMVEKDETEVEGGSKFQDCTPNSLFLEDCFQGKQRVWACLGPKECNTHTLTSHERVGESSALLFNLNANVKNRNS